MTLILDINGPDAKKLREEFKGHNMYRNECCNCDFVLGEGSNLTHTKEPYWYEYKFDAKVKVKCDNGERIMKCNNFRIRAYPSGLFHIPNYPECNNLPKNGLTKRVKIL